jgi:hypothetical protein
MYGVVAGEERQLSPLCRLTAQRSTRESLVTDPVRPPALPAGVTLREAAASDIPEMVEVVNAAPPQEYTSRFHRPRS